MISSFTHAWMSLIDGAEVWMWASASFAAIILVFQVCAVIRWLNQCRKGKAFFQE